ncbi:hypothetical protein [Flavobacterium orientale]|uniref:Uncharacterized protein n=1 Tax=Flavobacterium orientale TaxID=1756020 RepID=A0A917DGK2_9FLAO|nr:hypothetical protein [Flavobacterium orientale]GGD35391.1 hypothetical protein GCM10011343_26570 [Flavobacterium orientale]
MKSPKNAVTQQLSNSKNMTAIQNFWHQFEKVNLALHLLYDLPEEVALEKIATVTTALSAYHKNLGYQIIPRPYQSEFIITASGNPNFFQEVELLVYHAPKLERWKITAFIQPAKNLEAYDNGTDTPMEFEGMSLRISDMYFQAFVVPEQPFQLGIKVLLKNYLILEDHPNLEEAMAIQIEQLIGEKSFAKDLAFVELAQLTNADLEDSCVLQLYLLGLFIDTFEWE